MAALALAAAISLAEAPSHINQDAWLGLVDGRYIAQHRIPHTDTLAILTHGTQWIDQQWLAQLAIYGLYQLGGLPLYSIVYVALTVGSFGMAIAAARRLGGSEAQVLWVLPVAAFLYIAGSGQIRTQGFAYPLFVATLWLLAAEIRRAEPATRVPGISTAHPVGQPARLRKRGRRTGGALRIQPARHRPSRWAAGARARPRLGVHSWAPLCLLVTPYRSRADLLPRDPPQPGVQDLPRGVAAVTSSALLAVPFFAAAFASVWVLGLQQGQARLFNALILLILIAGGISAVRNVTIVRSCGDHAAAPVARLILPPARPHPVDAVSTSRWLASAPCSCSRR